MTAPNSPLEQARALLAARRLPEARVLYQELCRRTPGDADLWFEFGNLLLGLGESAAATQCYLNTIGLRPDFAEAFNNLGVSQTQQARYDAAVASYRKSLALKPNYRMAHTNLGNALMRLGKLDEALQEFQAAARLQPEIAELHSSIGIALHGLGRHDEAIGYFREALRLDPAHAKAHNNLGVALSNQGQLEQAAEHHRESLRLDPGQSESHLNLGAVLQAQGKLNEALDVYREFLGRRPDHAEAHDKLLFALNYLPDYTPAQIFEEHRRWGERHARAPAAIAPLANARDPGKRLKIGYVSPDFRAHSAAYFIEPILAHHDRDRFEICCYSHYPHSDAMTERLKSLARQWRNTSGMADSELATQVRADGIDILVDLAGHTGGNRLTAFAVRPAPVQITYLGYCNTTGLPAMDYRLTDAWADPPGQERFHSEELVRLPHGFLCYAPPPEAPVVAPLPSAGSGRITFGSFNHLAKINTEVVAMWARLLQALPQARLLIKNGSLRDAGTRARYHELFAGHGVERERVELASWTPAMRDHLAAYAAIDIALDSFPYNGTTTTCEALWMGVPVIALEGNRHAARVGVSLLSRVGLGELIAATPEQYIEIARTLSADPARLAGLRRGLRARVQASTLIDGPGFTRELEAAYRDLWQRWCHKLQAAEP